MKNIIADTNFLISQFEFGVDIYSELYRLVNAPFIIQIASGTIDEIKSMAGRKGRKAASARLVLQNFDKIKARVKVEIIESKGPVDEWIIKHARTNRVCVATNDVPLRKRLLDLGVPVIALKGKSKLGFI